MFIDYGDCVKVFGFKFFLPRCKPASEDMGRDLGYKLTVNIVGLMKMFEGLELDFLDTVVPVGHNGKKEIVFLPFLGYLKLNIGKGLMSYG